MGKVIMWSDEEIKFLIENWNEMSALELGERLGRPASGVRQKGKKLGLKTNADRFEKITGLKTWTKEEDEYMAKSWGNIKTSIIANKLGRTTASVQRRANTLNLKMTNDQLNNVTHMKIWTPQEKEFLMENYDKLPIEELAEKLGRKAITIRRRASDLGLTQKYTRWSKSQEEYLRDYWGERSVVATANYFRTKVSSVKMKAYKMGLGKQMEATGKWYTTKDIKEMLGVGQRTIYGWKDAGIIKFNKIKVGENTERYRVSLSNLRDFLESHPEKYDARFCDVRSLKAIFAKSKINNSDNLIISDTPIWLEAKIKSDWKKEAKVKPKEWTMKELSRLEEYAQKGYHPTELTDKMNRSYGSIRAKLYVINKYSA